jgi:hypothetical protein
MLLESIGILTTCLILSGLIVTTSVTTGTALELIKTKPILLGRKRHQR